MCHKEFFVGKIFEKCNACKKDLVSEHVTCVKVYFCKCIQEYTFVCFTVLVYIFYSMLSASIVHSSNFSRT